MNSISADIFVDVENLVGESPIWITSRRTLYWVDIVGKQILSMNDVGQGKRWRLPEMVGSIAHIYGNRWLVALESRLSIVDLSDDETVSFIDDLAHVQHAEPAMRFNDGRTDAKGRFWVSSMHLNMADALPVGRLYCLAGNQLSIAVDQSLIVGNGLAFSPDNRTMYLADSHASKQLVWAYDFDLDSGRASNQRVFADFNTLAGRPDGAAVDCEGCYWVCANDAGAVYRFTPAGVLDRTVTVPVKKPTMCAFGGAKGETLFITSIRPQGIDLSDQPHAGSVFAVDVGVRGLEEPKFFSHIR
jgi:sugar lactone lactonase YvrE